MCEIAVIDPEQASIESAQQIAGTFHEEQGDGLGVLAVIPDGDKFDYKVWKSTTPHWQSLYAFYKRNYDDAWRFVIHGRAKTSGEVNHETSHPIHVDCDLCDIDWVVHNGHVRRYSDKQEELIAEGHDLNTGVDTEVIAHKVGFIPDTVEHHRGATYGIYGNLNYLCFAEDGILVRMGEDRYCMSDDFTITCSFSRFTTDEEQHGFVDDNTNEWARIVPSEDGEPEIEMKDRSVYTVSRGQNAAGSSTVTGTSRAGNSWSSSNGTTTNTGRVTTPYGEYYLSQGTGKLNCYHEDLSEYEFLTVAKVAPGVLRVIDNETDDHDFVFEDENPKLYYWYCPDEEGEEDTTDEQQTTVEDFPISRVGHAITEEVKTTLVEEVDDLTLEDIADVDEEVLEAADRGATAVLESHKVAEGA